MDEPGHAPNWENTRIPNAFSLDVCTLYAQATKASVSLYNSKQGYAASQPHMIHHALEAAQALHGYMHCS